MISGPVLAGCQADNRASYVGQSTACKRAGLVKAKAEKAGIFVPDSIKVTAQYHCDHGLKQAEDVLPNEFYPQQVDASPCAKITRSPASNAAHRVEEAKCISVWADRSVYLLNGPPECIKPANLRTLSQDNTAAYWQAEATCEQLRAQAANKTSPATGFCGVAVVVIGIAVLIFFKVNFGGGSLPDDYMRNRS
jgi:hypothetical protein